VHLSRGGHRFMEFRLWILGLGLWRGGGIWWRMGNKEAMLQEGTKRDQSVGLEVFPLLAIMGMMICRD